MNHCIGCNTFAGCQVSGYCQRAATLQDARNQLDPSSANQYDSNRAHIDAYNRAQLAAAGAARMTKPTPTAERAQALVAELNEVAVGLRAAGWTVEVIATGPEFPVKLSLGWRSSEDDHS